MAVVRSKNASPTWSDVKTVLLDFDRAGLRGLVQDLYTASKDNQAFLHARLGLGRDQLLAHPRPFTAASKLSQTRAVAHYAVSHTKRARLLR